MRRKRKEIKKERKKKGRKKREERKKERKKERKYNPTKTIFLQGNYFSISKKFQFIEDFEIQKRGFENNNV